MKFTPSYYVQHVQVNFIFFGYGGQKVKFFVWFNDVKLLEKLVCDIQVVEKCSIRCVLANFYRKFWGPYWPLNYFFSYAIQQQKINLTTLNSHNFPYLYFFALVSEYKVKIFWNTNQLFFVHFSKGVSQYWNTSARTWWAKTKFLEDRYIENWLL